MVSCQIISDTLKVEIARNKKIRKLTLQIMAAKKRGNRNKGGSSTKKNTQNGNNHSKNDGNNDVDDVVKDFLSDFGDDTIDASLAAMISAATAVLLYFNSVILCQFPYDDQQAVVTNPDVLDSNGDGLMSPFSDVWQNDFWGTPVNSSFTHKSYRPLVIASFRFDAMISREAWIFHLTNTLLYAASAWLVVDTILSKALFLSSPGNNKSKDYNQVVLILSGLWFTAHPVHTEAVAGLVGRAEVLAAIFCMLGAKFHRKNTLLSAISLGAACLCKETAVVIPFVLLVVDLAPRVVLLLKKESPTGKGTQNIGLAAAVLRSCGMVSVCMMYLSFRSFLFAGKGAGLSDIRPEDSFVQFLGPTTRFRTALYIVAKYIQLLIIPERLSCDYGLGVIDPITSWVYPELAFVFLIASLVAFVSWKALWNVYKRGDTTLMLALGWIFAPLVPASHIVDIGTVLAERLLFIPSIGMCMLICHAASRYGDKLGTANVIAGYIVFILYFARMTLLRVPNWENNMALFSADAQTYPEGIKINLMLAKQHLNGTLNEVFPLLDRALETSDRYDKKESIFDNRPTTSDELKAQIYGIKGSALLRKGKREGNDQLVFTAADLSFHEMENRDVTHRAPYFAYCDYGLTSVLLGKKEQAYKAFRNCLNQSKNSNSLVEYKHLMNYCILMREFSGVATGDSQLAKTDRGKEGLEAFEMILDHPYLPPDQVGKWERQKEQLRSLMQQQ